MLITKLCCFASSVRVPSDMLMIWLVALQAVPAFTAHPIDGGRIPCHWVSRAAQDAMTAANLQPVGDVDRTELLNAFERKFGAGVRPLLQCKTKKGGPSYLSEVRCLHHALASLPVAMLRQPEQGACPCASHQHHYMLLRLVAGLDVRGSELQRRALRHCLPQPPLPSHPPLRQHHHICRRQLQPGRGAWPVSVGPMRGPHRHLPQVNHDWRCSACLRRQCRAATSGYW
jgi:hypothetical protein